MTTLINTLNAGQRLTELWRTGQLAGLLAQERLADLGFYAIAVGERHIVAWFNGHRFEF